MSLSKKLQKKPFVVLLSRLISIRKHVYNKTKSQKEIQNRKTIWQLTLSLTDPWHHHHHHQPFLHLGKKHINFLTPISDWPPTSPHSITHWINYLVHENKRNDHLFWEVPDFITNSPHQCLRKGRQKNVWIPM